MSMSSVQIGYEDCHAAISETQSEVNQQYLGGMRIITNDVSIWDAQVKLYFSLYASFQN